ncbi:MAG: 6-carboxytetrahydropterin synthase QueD [Dethiobacter sp.]|jgi:6-pyruvoyltetrahydropterin/6-carboxytetrahydropterin synthase|nr:6-carboxytetrahydropterin synthase QueD [Dethiobacter sp.]MBS3982782.1 6-carboxytetrahydropterin synthase QueD [Dethiobacter sp.]MCL4463475.1 6-carboxytetrahydropterin synthase QueD [Bacillota bacterium]MCL5993705.1 6-carboxytetrahydropterin synthase QueD [Bacillota bacterium]
MLSITKTFNFDSAHWLTDYEGSCGQLHGHRFKLEITVAGELVDGMVMDFGELKEIVKPVVEQLDHKCLNHILPFRTTAENILGYVVNEVAGKLPARVSLKKARLWETPTSYAEWEK